MDSLTAHLAAIDERLAALASQPAPAAPNMLPQLQVWSCLSICELLHIVYGPLLIQRNRPYLVAHNCRPIVVQPMDSLIWHMSGA